MMAASLVNPICYNILELFGASNQNQIYRSGFAVFYSPMQEIPFFGKQYNSIVPLIIALVSIVSLFSPGALLRKITRGRLFIEEEDYDKYLADLQEGVELLQAEKEEKEYRAVLTGQKETRKKKEEEARQEE